MQLGTRGRVVVIDDDVSFRKVLRAALELDGFEVTTVSDEASAFEILSQSVTDAVVLDLNLAGSDGLDFLVRLRAMPDIGAMPVLILTADDRAEHRRRGRNLGADRYMTKPVDLELLVWNLETIVSQERPERANPLAGLRQAPIIPPDLLST